MYTHLFGLVVGIAPAVAVSMIGLVVAIERRAQHPRVSLFASLGLLGVIGAKVGGVVFQLWITDTAQSGANMAALAMRMAGINFALNGLSAIGIALIVAAIYMDRARGQTNA